jgi:hypothetical protein
MMRRTERKNGRGVRWCHVKAASGKAEPMYSRGAASDVRHIDPATYQPPEPAHTSSRPVAQQNKTVALLDAADKLLVADAKRRHGKRYAADVRERIVGGRY